MSFGRTALLTLIAFILVSCGGGGGGGSGATTTTPPASSNANLSSLSLSSVSIAPAFNSLVTSYTATVDFDIDSVSVSVLTQDANARVLLNGVPAATNNTVDLVEGMNTFAILVTAENGSATRTYSLEITRETQPVDPSRYFFSRGDGELTIIEIGSAESDNDTLEFDNSIDISDLDFERIDNDLIISIYGTSDQIILVRWFAHPIYQVDELLFADGQTVDIPQFTFQIGATGSSDWLTGTNATDVFNGLEGDDILIGRGGNDQILGDFGDDLIEGGEGADQLNGGVGTDTARYKSSTFGVTVYIDNSQPATGGDAAGDSFAEIENLIGSNFDDVLSGDNFVNNIQGIDGNDIINGLGGPDHLFGGTGNDMIDGGSGQDYIEGNEGADEIVAGTGSDVIDGGDGDDRIFAGSGYDEVIGGNGMDEIHGELDDDLIYGDEDADQLFGDGGNDEIYGGNDDDNIWGGLHADKLFGEQGADVVDGESGDDFIQGGDGDDTLIGGLDNDIIEGGLGDDSINGSEGNDFLIGNEGIDQIFGGSGSDFLIGENADVLMGEDDTDFYNFDGDFGQVSVIENPNRLAIDELIFSGISANQLWLELQGNNLVVSILGTPNQVTLENYAKFRIHVDELSLAMGALKNVFDSQSVIDSLNVATQRLSVADIDALQNFMSVFPKPNSISEIPPSIQVEQNARWANDELLALNDRIQYSPVLNSISDTMREDTTYVGQFQATDANPEEIFTYSIQNPPNYGELVVDSNTGEFSFTPDLNFSGYVSALISVSDSTGLSGNASLQLQVLAEDDPGSFASQITMQTNEGNSIAASFDFLDSDNGFDDYHRTHDAHLGNIDFNSDGSFTFIPFQNADGIDQFSVTFTDRSGRVYTTEITIEIFPVNDYPSTPPLIERSLNEDSIAGANGYIAVSDPDDSDTHTFNIIQNGAGNLSVFSDGQYIYHVLPNFQGEDHFVVRIIDSSGDPLSFSDTEIVITVAGVNDQPTTDATVNLVTNLNQTVDGNVNLVDPDIIYGDTHAFSASPNSGQIVFNSDGTFSYTPNNGFVGIDSFIAEIEDSAGSVSNVTINVSVSP